LRVASALVRFVVVDFADADFGFGFAFAVLLAVAALVVARARVVRRTLDAAAMRRSPFRNFRGTRLADRPASERRIHRLTLFALYRNDA
jgi:hypothetical protein